MAGTTNKDRLDDLEKRLGQLETALGLKPPQPKSTFTQFREHLWQQTKSHWKAVVPIVAIIVGVSGWFASGWFKYYLDHRYDFIDGMIDKNLSAKGGVKDTLAGVQQTVTRTDATLNTLVPFIHDVIQHQFESASKLPTATLQERLPAVQHLLAVANDQGINADTPILDALGRKLRTVDTKTASFWPTTAQFISYRSQTLVADLQELRRTDLPNCTDRDPTPMELTIGEEDEKAWKRNESRPLPEVPSKNGTKFSSALYHDCRFTLDSPEETSRIPNLREQRSYFLTFRHCQIVYRGGHIALLTPNPKPAAITGKSAKRTDVYMFGDKRCASKTVYSFSS